MGTLDQRFVLILASLRTKKPATKRIRVVYCIHGRLFHAFWSPKGPALFLPPLPPNASQHNFNRLKRRFPSSESSTQILVDISALWPQRRYKNDDLQATYGHFDSDNIYFIG